MNSVGTVYFRFKHQKIFDRIEFSGREISVAELKLKIIEKLVLVEKHAHASAIQLYRPSTDRYDTNTYGEMYEFDSELVPANTSVLIFRTPTKAVGAKIAVASMDFFPSESKLAGDDPFALRASVLAHEHTQRKRVPDGLVCVLCKHFMTMDHVPVILHCCGCTICRVCALSGAPCPSQCESGAKFGLNRGLARLTEVVWAHRAEFGFDEGVILPKEVAQAAISAPVEEEIIDLDEVVDVEQPLSAKEIEQIERRARRKRKAAELLLKKEIVKGELTEGEISKLFKQELKTDLDEMHVLGGGALSKSSVVTQIIEFPKLLTADEFSRWLNQ